MEISIPAPVRTALSVLHANGFEACIVGGCVRDSLLGRTPFDWDIATSALPREIIACFTEHRTMETGVRHGTITVFIENSGIEITTFRQDGTYTDSRHPDAVTFSRNLADDLSRRDFTVNAMAYNETAGLIDAFGGLADLKQKLLRCVGDAKTRFSEDALRIMRCVRFASELGFAVEPDTQAAMEHAKALLHHISSERIQIELSKLLCGAYASQALRRYASVLFEILPELAPMHNCAQETRYHIYDVWEHTLHALEHSPPKLTVRLALLLHDSGKPRAKSYGADGTAHFYDHGEYSTAIAEAVLTRLRYPKKVVQAVCLLVKNHDNVLPLKDRRIKKLLAELGEGLFFDLLAVMRGDVSAQAPFLIDERLKNVETTRRRTEEMLSGGVCFSLSRLAVNGADLIALGFQPGPQLGRTLNELLHLVMTDQVPNEKNRLLAIARRRLPGNHSQN